MTGSNMDWGVQDLKMDTIMESVRPQEGIGGQQTLTGKTSNNRIRKT